MVPCDNRTMCERGVKQVDICGKDDKREITVLLACTLSGKLQNTGYFTW